MQRLSTITLTPADAVANSFATSQKPADGGVQALNMNGAAMTAGVAAIPTARRVAISSSADDTARTFTITGVGRNGNAQSETLVGPGLGLTVNTVNDYGSGPLSVSVDANTAGNIVVGTSQVLSSAWVPIDRVGTWGISVAMSKTAPAATWDVEHTLDDPFTPGVGVNGTGDPALTPIKKADMQGMAAAGEGAYTTPVTAIRFTLLTFSTGAAVTMRLAPAG